MLQSSGLFLLLITTEAYYGTLFICRRVRLMDAHAEPRNASHQRDHQHIFLIGQTDKKRTPQQLLRRPMTKCTILFPNTVTCKLVNITNVTKILFRQ